jgi:methyl-accepting chemotaxis protein
MMSNNESTRRNLFIQKRFQSRFILGAFVVILLAGLSSALLVYWLGTDDLRAQSLSAHANLAEASDRLGLSIAIGNVVSILVAGAVAVISVLYASHKIAGPLYRFEKLCEEIGDGNLNCAINLRAKDQLHALADAFAAMVEKLRNQRKLRNDTIATLHDQLAMLRNTSSLSEEQKEIIAAMVDTLNQLDY